jgi:hypothetical protein
MSKFEKFSKNPIALELMSCIDEFNRTSTLNKHETTKKVSLLELIKVKEKIRSVYMKKDAAYFNTEIDQLNIEISQSKSQLLKMQQNKELIKAMEENLVLKSKQNLKMTLDNAQKWRKKYKVWCEKNKVESDKLPAIKLVKNNNNYLVNCEELVQGFMKLKI